MDPDYNLKNVVNPNPGIGGYPIRKNEAIKTSWNFYRNTHGARKTSVKAKHMNRKTPIHEKVSKRSSFNYRNKLEKSITNYRESSEGLAINEFKMNIVEDPNSSINPRFVLPARNITEKLNHQYCFHGYHTSVLANKKSKNINISKDLGKFSVSNLF